MIVEKSLIPTFRAPIIHGIKRIESRYLSLLNTFRDSRHYQVENKLADSKFKLVTYLRYHHGYNKCSVCSRADSMLFLIADDWGVRSSGDV